MEYKEARFAGCEEYPSEIAAKIDLTGYYYFQICEDEDFIESEPHTRDYIEIMATCGNVLIKNVKILPAYYPMVELAYESIITWHGFAGRGDEIGANLKGMQDAWGAGEGDAFPNG